MPCGTRANVAIALLLAPGVGARRCAKLHFTLSAVFKELPPGRGSRGAGNENRSVQEGRQGRLREIAKSPVLFSFFLGPRAPVTGV